MPSIGFSSYGGSSPITSSVRGALEAQGSQRPEGYPYSDALLTGLAGGLAFGYFVFEYGGQDPQVNLLTRNTFGNYGWDPLQERLGLTQDVIHSTTEAKAQAKLVETLDAGQAPVVWADVFTLGYEYSDFGEGMWAMQPVVVSAYEPGGEATIADRSSRPITIAAATLDEARGKVKKDKYRLVVLDAAATPDLDASIRAAIADTVALFTEKPPQGSANNFGFKAYDRWIKALSGNAKSSWTGQFTTGRARFAALTTAVRYGLTFWEDTTGTADRTLFAEFLKDARVVTGEDACAAAAKAIEQSATLWSQLGEALTPDDHDLLARGRRSIVDRHTSFMNEGVTPKIAELDATYDQLKDEASDDAIPDDVFQKILASASEIIAEIRNTEQEAIEFLRSAFA